MKRITLALVTVLAITFMACQDEETNATLGTDFIAADLESESTTNYVDEDVSDIVEAGIEAVPSGSNGRVELGVRGQILKCAEVEHDTINKIITIEYDSLSDCQNPFGHTRHGKMIITYNDRRYVPGAFRSVTFENFSIDDVKVEGTRTITNISESLEDNLTFNVVVEGGKLTFADETTIERTVDHIRTWMRANNPINDEATLEGSASGKRRDGTSYSVEIIEPLLFKRECRPAAALPVSGIKEITWDDSVMTVDFGDGTCDNLVDVTMDGVTETIEVNPRGFRR